MYFALFNNKKTARPAQVFCYLTSWSAKRPGVGKFEPKNIDASLCTHIVYAFATLKDHILTEANDDDPENYDKLIELREKNPDLQVCLIDFLFTKSCYRMHRRIHLFLNRFYWRSVDGLSAQRHSKSSHQTFTE